MTEIPDHLRQRSAAARAKAAGRAGPTVPSDDSPLFGGGGLPGFPRPNPNPSEPSGEQLLEDVADEVLTQVDSSSKLVAKKITEAFADMPDGELLTFKISREDGMFKVEFAAADTVLAGVVVNFLEKL